MQHDPTFWRGKAQHFRDIADLSDSEILAAALRSRADELDAIAMRLESGGAPAPRRLPEPIRS